MMLRRSFLQGMVALFIAPAIVRAESLMPIKEFALPVPAWCPDGWLPLDGREIKKKFYPDLYSAYQRMRFEMVLSNDQEYTPYTGYETIERAAERSGTLNFKRIISSQDLIRSNGKIMRAGVCSTIQVTENGAA